MAIPPHPTDAQLLAMVKNVMPDSFYADAGDAKILGFVDLVINDLNWWLPMTNYSREDFPGNWTQTIVFGTQVFATMFKQMEATLQDFDYNDNGLTVRVDQVTKINTSYTNMLKAYAQIAENTKKSRITGMGVSLGTPMYQSQIGSFLKIALGSSFNWGSP